MCVCFSAHANLAWFAVLESMWSLVMTTREISLGKFPDAGEEVGGLWPPSVPHDFMFALQVELQPRAGSNSPSKGEDNHLLALTNDLMESIPPAFDVPSLRSTMPAPLPTQAFLLQELDRFNMVGSCIQKFNFTLQWLYCFK